MRRFNAFLAAVLAATALSSSSATTSAFGQGSVKTNFMSAAHVLAHNAEHTASRSEDRLPITSDVAFRLVSASSSDRTEAAQLKAAAAARDHRSAVNRARQARARALAAKKAAAKRWLARKKAQAVERHRLATDKYFFAQYVVVHQYHWSSDQYRCVKSLWDRESSWLVHLANNGSSAYGIPQSLPGSKMSKFGGDWRDNFQTQIKWGLWYIADRYGSPCAAWDHSNRYNYY